MNAAGWHAPPPPVLSHVGLISRPQVAGQRRCTVGTHGSGHSLHLNSILKFSNPLSTTEGLKVCSWGCGQVGRQAGRACLPTPGPRWGQRSVEGALRKALLQPTFMEKPCRNALQERKCAAGSLHSHPCSPCPQGTLPAPTFHLVRTSYGSGRSNCTQPVPTATTRDTNRMRSLP